MVRTALLVAFLLVHAQSPSTADRSSRSWYLRGHGGGAPATTARVRGSPAPDGTSYAAAWRSAADITWARIRPGDRLFLCGRIDIAVTSADPNTTCFKWSCLEGGLHVDVSGLPGAPVALDGECPDGRGGLDPGVLIGGRALPFRTGTQPPAASGWAGPDSHGIWSLRWSSRHPPPSIRNRFGMEMRLSDGATSRPTYMNCTPAGPVDPASWPPGSWCGGVRPGLGSHTVWFKPSDATAPATLYTDSGVPPLVVANTSFVTVQNIQILGPTKYLVVV